ncbi:MAG: hypothetical protein EOP04_10290, partial [Proteobacteria bacterium]
MKVSLTHKIVSRLKKQGPIGLLCVALIKMGNWLQKFGFMLEKRIFLSNGKKAERKHYGSYPGVLEIVQRSYEQDTGSILEPRSVHEDVAWIIPPFSKGSGGHTTIFRFISGLEKLGVKCKIYILNDMDVYLNPTKLREDICQFFSPILADVEVLTSSDMVRDANILICTSWQTAFAARIMPANRKIYFMQDYEPYFSPVGSYYFFAEQTYRMGFEYFTAGPWLLSIAKDKFNGEGDFFYLCPDRSNYYPRAVTSLRPLLKIKEDRNESRERLFLIGLYNRAHTPRRCVEMVWVALSLLAEKNYPFKVLTFGDDEHRVLPFLSEELGILNHDELAEVYSACDIVIAPSATNLSLLAREVMACGTIVLDLEGENTDQQLHHMEDSVLCRPEVSEIYKALES